MSVILIVEDDAFIRELAELIVQDLCHQTLLASDVDEALSLLRSPEHIDALLPISISKQRSLAGMASHTRQSSFGQICVCSTRQAISLPTK